MALAVREVWIWLVPALPETMRVGVGRWDTRVGNAEMGRVGCAALCMMSRRRSGKHGRGMCVCIMFVYTNRGRGGGPNTTGPLWVANVQCLLFGNVRYSTCREGPIHGDGLRFEICRRIR